MATDTADYSTIQTTPDNGTDSGKSPDDNDDAVVVDDSSETQTPVIDVGQSDASAHSALAVIQGSKPASTPTGDPPGAVVLPASAPPPTAADLNNPANPASPLNPLYVSRAGAMPAVASLGPEPKAARMDVKLLDIEFEHTLVHGAEFVGAGILILLALVVAVRSLWRRLAA